jgi:hypothetical protein
MCRFLKCMALEQCSHGKKMPDFNYIPFTFKYFNRITNSIQARRIPVNPLTRCIHAIARQI